MSKKSDRRHKIIRTFAVDGFIDWDGSPHLTSSVIRNIHEEHQCAGRYCVIHNPSDHHMRNLPLIWNSPESQMERLCDHDFTHPDPDDIAYWVDIAQQPWKAVHECCPHNCCNKENQSE